MKRPNTEAAVDGGIALRLQLNALGPAATELYRRNSLGVSLRAARQILPPLESGDRLSAHEFLRRYEAMPELKRVQLINGVVFMPSPIRLQHHAHPRSVLQTWLGVYAANTRTLLAARRALMRRCGSDRMTCRNPTHCFASSSRITVTNINQPTGELFATSGRLCRWPFNKGTDMKTTLASVMLIFFGGIPAWVAWGMGAGPQIIPDVLFQQSAVNLEQTNVFTVDSPLAYQSATRNQRTKATTPLL